MIRPHRSPKALLAYGAVPGPVVGATAWNDRRQQATDLVSVAAPQGPPAGKWGPCAAVSAISAADSASWRPSDPVPAAPGVCGHARLPSRPGWPRPLLTGSAPGCCPVAVRPSDAVRCAVRPRLPSVRRFVTYTPPRSPGNCGKYQDGGASSQASKQAVPGLRLLALNERMSQLLTACTSQRNGAGKRKSGSHTGS